MLEIDRHNKEHKIPDLLFKDQRSLRKFPPAIGADLLLERDSALALIHEQRSQKHKQRLPIKYWGIIAPGDIKLLEMEMYLRHCSNCINGVYTNVWTNDQEKFKNGKNWVNFYILSPDYQYPKPFSYIIDCLKK